MIGTNWIKKWVNEVEKINLNLNDWSWLNIVTLSTECIHLNESKDMVISKLYIGDYNKVCWNAIEIHRYFKEIVVFISSTKLYI